MNKKEKSLVSLKTGERVGIKCHVENGEMII